MKESDIYKEALAKKARDVEMILQDHDNRVQVYD